MIIIEYLIIGFFLCVLFGTAALIINKLSSSSSKSDEARKALAEALKSKSRQRIQDTVIIYGDLYPKEIKEAVKIRIDELWSEEVDTELERKIDEL